MKIKLGNKMQNLKLMLSQIIISKLYLIIFDIINQKSLTKNKENILSLMI